MLWENNIFSCVCLSVILSGGLPIWPLLMIHWTWPWPYIEPLPTCTDLPCVGALPDMFKLVHYEACAVGKLVVGVLLEWFLFCSMLSSTKTPPVLGSVKLSFTYSKVILLGFTGSLSLEIVKAWVLTHELFHLIQIKAIQSGSKGRSVHLFPVLVSLVSSIVSFVLHE